MFLSLVFTMALGSIAPSPRLAPSTLVASASERIRLPAKLAKNTAVLRARDALEAALGPAKEAEPLYVVFVDAQGSDLRPDGYSLSASGGTSAVALRARNVRGACYALHELARRARLEQWSPGEPIELLRNPAFEFRLGSMHDNPGEPRFDTQFRDPKVLLDLGFNGMIIHGQAGLCTYDEYDARLYPEGSAERATVLADRERVRSLIAEAKRNQLLVFLNGDQLCVPRSAIELYGAELLADPGKGAKPLLSPSKPKLHELVRATYQELLRHFPEVDGFQVRTGEVYVQSEPTLFGHIPFWGTDDASRDWTKERKLRALVDTITKVVCDEHGKRFNLRMWGYYDSAHSEPDKWTSFANELEPHPLRTFSFKHARTDHWRWNVVNPNFGLGEHAQWAEFQMAREYEGKGAFPSYLGRYLAEGPTEIAPTGGLAELHARGVRGAWCWARGGGWRGPFPASEDWIALNMHAFARLLWDPSDDPWEIARQWSVLEFGFEPGSLSAQRFVRIQELSERALLESRYIGTFIEKGHLKNGSGWTPDGNWTRDDELGVRNPRLPADQQWPPARMFFDYLSKDGTVDAAIAERERAIDLWKELVTEFDELVEEARAPTRLVELRNTAVYGQRVFDTASHSFIAGWTAYAWAEAGKKQPRRAAKAREHLALARAAWKDCTERVFKLPGVASPYAEYGFSTEWTAVEALLDGRAEVAPYATDPAAAANAKD